MNRIVNREIHARNQRQKDQRVFKAFMLGLSICQRRALIRLWVAMTYKTHRGGVRRWLYLTRWISVYKQAERMWRSFLIKWADQAEAERQAAKNAAERIRVEALAAFEAQQNERRAKGATPSQLRRAERRFAAGISQ